MFRLPSYCLIIGYTNYIAKFYAEDRPFQLSDRYQRNGARY